ncbi:hypothetical protein [uncultured Salipiger sp.]|uniref:hypothetical protein n=1 Tax=uncultured Salipiger sp. TaxID=499810 RepID=UPI0025979A05|nr:hypothetical protein [uncultured Salipiger sp.]
MMAQPSRSAVSTRRPMTSARVIGSSREVVYWREHRDAPTLGRLHLTRPDRL